MSELIDVLDREFKKYVAEKIGETKAQQIAFSVYANFSDGRNGFSRACGAASRLHEDYDLGIALATDGLWLGYIAEAFGFPVKSVRMKRMGRGAIWEPIDKLYKKDLKGKRVVVFDNDCITGKSLRRAVREIESYSPSFIDLLLIHERTPITAKMYMSGKVPVGLPSPVEILEETFEENGSAHVAYDWDVTESGIEINYWHDGNGGIPKVAEFKSPAWLTMLNVRTNIPSNFRKVQTVQRDFQPDYKAVGRFEAIIRGRVNE